MKKPKFYGSTTVGERGQIVLPAQLRKEFKISKGQKLLVMGHPGGNNITLLSHKAMDNYLQMIIENVNEIKSKMNIDK